MTTLHSLLPRPATSADREFLWALRQTTMRCYVEPIRGWDESIERSTAHDLNGCWILHHAGSPAGAAQINVWPDSLHLTRLQLPPHLQGRGIGTQVVQYLQHQLAAPIRRPVTLQVLPNNPARRLYARLGFATCAESQQMIEMRWDPAP